MWLFFLLTGLVGVLPGVFASMTFMPMLIGIFALAYAVAVLFGQ